MNEVIDKIEKVIRDVKPQRVYTHSISDTHQDHRNIAYSTLAAARFVPEILCYESPSLYIGFNPNYYVDITKFIDEKEKVLSIFTTQNHKEYMKINAIQGLAQFRAIGAGSVAAYGGGTCAGGATAGLPCCDAGGERGSRTAVWRVHAAVLV